MVQGQSVPGVRVGIRAKLLAAALAIVFGFGLCEVAARVVYPAPPERMREPKILYEPHPEMGFFHIPNQRGWLDDGLATINALGLRGELPRSPKPDRSVRVLAIGDSTTFGWGVNDAETYTVRLEGLLLNAHPERQPSVVNGGVVSYDLKRAARLLRHFAPVLQPDIVLVGAFWNDLPYEAVSPEGVALAAAPQSNASSTPPAATFRIGQPSRLNRILRSSRLLYVLRHGWLAAVAETDAATNQVRWEMALLEGKQSPAIDDAWRDVERTLSEIRSLARTRGFAVGVVIMPIRAQVEASYPHAQYQTRVRAIAESLGMFVVDPLPRFVAHAREDLFIPYDRMHFSARGNAQIADAAFEALRLRPELRDPHTD